MMVLISNMVGYESISNYVLEETAVSIFRASYPERQGKSWRCGKVKIGKGHPCTGTELCTGRTAHRGSRRIALPFHDHSTTRG